MSARPRLTSNALRRLPAPPSAAKRDARWMMESTTKTWKELTLPHISVGEQDIVNMELLKFSRSIPLHASDDRTKSTSKRESFPPMFSNRSTVTVTSPQRIKNTSLNLIKSEPVLQKSGRQRRNSGSVASVVNKTDSGIVNQASGCDLRDDLMTLFITGHSVLKRK